MALASQTIYTQRSPETADRFQDFSLSKRACVATLDSHIEKLQQQIEEHSSDFGGEKFILTLLYEVCNEANRTDDEQIKADINTLYQSMNGLAFKVGVRL